MQYRFGHTSSYTHLQMDFAHGEATLCVTDSSQGEFAYGKFTSIRGVEQY